MVAIQIKEFSKQYRGLTAVSAVSLEVQTAELFGLIGPDGAGKTTLMRSICTLLKPTAGTISVNGKDTVRDIMSIRRILGYMPQRFSLYQDLTVQQNLQFFADLFHVPSPEREVRLQRLYQFSRLEPFKGRLAGALSGGMKQKLALSCALIHTPQVLILDEPTYGVDPLSREEFWEILKSIRQEGTTILVSTAYMEEAELCDRVALMHRGKIVATGNPGQIKAAYPYPLYRVQGKAPYDLRQFFRALSAVKDTQLFGNSVHVSFRHVPQEQHWRQWKNQLGNGLESWQIQSPSMEDVFMSLIQQENHQ